MRCFGRYGGDDRDAITHSDQFGHHPRNVLQPDETVAGDERVDVWQRGGHSTSRRFVLVSAGQRVHPDHPPRQSSQPGHLRREQIRVIAFEPWPKALRYLRHNIEVNHLERVTVVPAAAFDENGHAEIWRNHPAEVLSVRIDEEHKIANVIVPERQLSLAIGKEGQNARLAAKLTGWRIDIRPDTAPVDRPPEARAEAPASGAGDAAERQ